MNASMEYFFKCNLYESKKMKENDFFLIDVSLQSLWIL